MSQPDEELKEKYKGLLEGLRLKFEGLQNDTEEALVNLAMVLGAEVSDNAPYTFVQKSYFMKEENKRRRNLYDINYIHDSVKEGRALSMDKYKFSPVQSSQISLNDELMCPSSRFILKVDSCHKCYYKRIFCKECVDLLPVHQNDARQIILATDSESEEEVAASPPPKSESEEEVAASPQPKSETQVFKRLMESDESDDQEKIKSNGVRKKPVRKRSKNSSDTEMKRKDRKDDSSETDIENDGSRSNVNLVNNAEEEKDEESSDDIFEKALCSYQRQKGAPESKNVEEDMETDDDLPDKVSPSRSNTVNEKNQKLSQNKNLDEVSSSKSNSEDEENQKLSQNKNVGKAQNGTKEKLLVPKRENVEEENEEVDELSPSKSNIEDEKKQKLSQGSAKGSDWIQPSKSKPSLSQQSKNEVISDEGSSSDISLHTDDEEEKYFKEKVWWQPHDIPEKEKCTITSCSFEPRSHRAHFPPTRVMSMIEKKILVKYLVMTNKISQAKGSSIYEEMRSEGYLTHRSAETLRNCFRRTIIKEIANYKLDKQYVTEFKRLRVKTSGSSKVKHEKS